MALSAENQRLIARQMKTLDYVEGSGLFPREKRSVNDNRYLIISYGGTGSDALHQVKKLLQDELPEEDYKTHVRVLAIDTDSDTRYEKGVTTDASGQQTVIQIDRFTPGEFLWLDNKPARNAIVMGNYDSMKDWINPTLPETIKATANMLDGTGAGATRQLGRVLLSPSETFNNFLAKVKQVAGELTNGNADNLKVFMITGISGGTGSGIVIDASYMIRHAIKEMGGALSNRTTFTGFILLPPTGKESAATLVERGNRNGIAAMKEIDHFMTIANRNEQYAHKFGNTNVICKENIFDTCYLLDGSTSNVTNENPREKAVEVLKDCILDMITSQPVISEGASTVADVASFMCDAPAFQQALVANESENIAPREANYVYCAIGHGQMLIPLELMKAYVAKSVFDRMYGIFQNFRNVEEEDVEDFLDDVGCPGTGVFTGASGNSPMEFRAAVNKKIAECFVIDPNNRNKKGGPYFVINLLAAVMTELRERSNTVSGLAMGTARQKRCDEYRMIYQIVQENNNKYFEVYVAVFEELKKYLEKSSEILCDSKLFRDYYKSSYTFTPIDFGNLDAASKVVKDYLDGLISGVKVGRMCSDLVKEILENREEWSELVVTNGNAMPRFAAPHRIRTFWQRKINEIVDATLEDYLIKYYSGDPKAEWEVDADGTPTPAANAALKKAATALVKQMWGPAGAAVPLAELHTNIMVADRFNGKKSFLIPKGAPHLIEYVKAELKANVNVAINSIQVAPSTANDRISCYAQFTSIPAFMFRWATRAEPHYEQYIQASTNGLHMSETTGGALWRNFPNLIPQVMWPHVEVGYSIPREAELNKVSRAMFAEAKALGLTTLKALDNNNEVGYYTVKYLPATSMIDGMFLKAVDSEMDGTPAKAKAQAALDAEVERLANELYSKKDWTTVETIAKADAAQAVSALVSLDEYKLQFVHTVMTPLTSPKPADWEDNLAAALLRSTPENSYRLRGTVLVLDCLHKMIRKAQAAAESRIKFARYLVAELFSYDENEGVWYYLNAVGAQTQLLEIPYGNRAMETAEHYFLFNAFNENAEAVIDALDSKYQDMLDAPTPGERKQKAKAMFEKKEPVLAKVKELITFDKSNPTRPCVMNDAFAKAAAPHKYDVAAIRDFYVKLANDLEYFTL